MAANKKSYMTSDSLIASVKRRIMLPMSQVTFTDEDLLAFADEEMSMSLVPDILIMHEDYLMFTELVPLQENQTRYQIPYRATGNKLREVSYRDGSGNFFEMTRIGVGDLPSYNNTTNNQAYAFYVENNEVCLVPANIRPAQNSFIAMTFYMRPNSLVLLEEVAVISAVDRTTGEIQVSNLPATFSINETFDLIKVQSPNKNVAYDITAISINSTSKTITLDPADIPNTLSAGDHIAIAETCAIPQIPSDLHVVLAHMVATRCLEAMGDTEGLQNANQKKSEMEAKMTTLIDNRVEDAPRKIVNRNSILRSGLNSRGRFRIRG